MNDEHAQKSADRSASISNALLGAVAFDFIHLEVSDDDSLYSLKEKFYSIARKHGIKQGTRVANGIQCDNPEWVAAKDMFLSCLRGKLEMAWIFNSDVPEDLRCY